VVIDIDDFIRRIDGRIMNGADAWAKATDEWSSALRRVKPSRVIVLVGLMCSGKSTWAKANDEPGFVIFDGCNTTKAARRHLIDLAEAAGVRRVEAVMIEGDRETCTERATTKGRHNAAGTVAAMLRALRQEPLRRSDGFFSVTASTSHGDS
jgi:predicted kinase